MLNKNITIEDDFFGTMVPLNADELLYSCKRQFKPSMAEIDVVIQCNATGPTEMQKGFFKCIEAAYDKVATATTPIITKEIKKQKEAFEIIDFRKEFTPVYLSLPRCDSNPIIWKIGFESKHNQDHTLTITYHNFEAVEIEIEG